MIKIRATDDLDEIFRLDRQVFLHDSAIPTSELDDALWWLAEMGGEPVGYAGMIVQEDERHGGQKVFLHRAGVVQQARGAGLQQRLIRVRTAAAARLGVKRAYTYVWAGNVPSMRSLIHCGFLPYYSERPAEQTWVFLERFLVARKPKHVPLLDACTTETSSPAPSP